MKNPNAIRNLARKEIKIDKNDYDDIQRLFVKYKNRSFQTYVSQQLKKDFILDIDDDFYKEITKDIVEYGRAVFSVLEKLIDEIRKPKAKRIHNFDGDIKNLVPYNLKLRDEIKPKIINHYEDVYKDSVIFEKGKKYFVENNLELYKKNFIRIQFRVTEEDKIKIKNDLARLKNTDFTFSKYMEYVLLNKIIINVNFKTYIKLLNQLNRITVNIKTMEVFFYELNDDTKWHIHNSHNRFVNTQISEIKKYIMSSRDKMDYLLAYWERQ